MGDDMDTALDITIREADGMREFGAKLGALLLGGDLIVLDGPLGAGKTTLAQGIAEGMGVRGRVTSPTFTIARVHAALGAGPDLVHVDAYRIGALEEVDALDLDSSLDRAVTLVEWGEEKVEALSPDRLEIQVLRPHGAVRAEHPQPEDAPAGVCGRREVQDDRIGRPYPVGGLESTHLLHLDVHPSGFRLRVREFGVGGVLHGPRDGAFDALGPVRVGGGPLAEPVRLGEQDGQLVL